MLHKIKTHWQPSQLLETTLCIFLGLVFIYSAWTKSNPILVFSISIMDFGISSWALAYFIAYFIICIEFVLGFLFIFKWNVDKYLTGFSIVFLLLLTLVIVYQLFFRPEMTDCGCFGEKLAMTPLESLVKNIVLLLVCFFLYMNKPRAFITSKMFLVSISLGAIIYPLFINEWKLNIENQPLVMNHSYPFQFAKLNHVDSAKVDSLKKGKWIIVCLSSECRHCSIAAKKTRLIHNLNNRIPFHVLVLGNQTKVDSFLKASQANHLPHTPIENMLDMITITLGNVPLFLWVEDGLIVKKSSLVDLNQSDIEDWLKK